ncbi:MotA/TolQ/ExbB proton channel family protein [Echinicola jeungdonensis]|uniref:MotA/TolQ/ExbB proton channel family protein n=1 Tax=Echinicola jeungdonensis TaxID=709343 RepID=A0ABV5J339_9BACT|nr:MotA/TolQ/ExbB proton channel family protein [Echinicola jeungdonensis]MDN3669064.1 MotA/TolQ/ExbB proton channel family protein [Echinicola jeungdonensis]
MMELFDLAPYAWLPLSCGLIVIVVGFIKLLKLRQTKNPEAVGIFEIWLMGIIALLLGILGPILNMMRTFDAFSHAGDISPSIVANGIKSSYTSIIIGLAVLVISLIIWGILKETKQNRIISKTIDKVNLG